LFAKKKPRQIRNTSKTMAALFVFHAEHSFGEFIRAAKLVISNANLVATVS
jgi:hypothetical protein